MRSRSTRAGVAAIAAVLMIAVASSAWLAHRHAMPSDPLRQQSGLDAVLQLDRGPASDVATERRTRNVEASIVTCMAHSGFAYRPRQTTRAASQGPRPPANVDDARTIGYGLSTELGRARPASDDAADPNAATLKGLSDPARNAWQERLGDPTKGGSCWAAAERHADEALRPILGDLSLLAAAFAREAGADEELGALDRRWARCMAEARFAVADREEVYRLLDGRLAAARTASDAGSPRSYRAEDLARVQALERRLATADARCTAPLANEYRKTVDHLASTVRTAHPAEVARVRDHLDR